MTRAYSSCVCMKEKKLTWSFLKKCCFGYMSVFMLLLFFRYPDPTTEWVRRGIDTCVGRLIPSLFPFMVVSALLTSSGVGEKLGRIVQKPFGALFGVSAQGAAALLLGWLFGFPIGARSASGLYREGKISGSEFERIVCISGVPSPAFLVNFAGAALLGSAKKGIALYIICLASCMLIGVAIKAFWRSDDETERRKVAASPRASVAVAFTRAVSESTVGMLYVCGFVVFFSAFIGALDNFILSVVGEYPMTDAMFGFFEITVGISRISALDIPSGAAFVACAAVSAWSGLSVHLQIISLCSDSAFPVSRYFAANAAKALISTLLSLAVLPILRRF